MIEITIKLLLAIIVLVLAMPGTAVLFAPHTNAGIPNNKRQAQLLPMAMQH